MRFTTGHFPQIRNAPKKNFLVLFNRQPFEFLESLLGRQTAKTGANRFWDFYAYVQRRDFAGRNPKVFL